MGRPLFLACLHCQERREKSYPQVYLESLGDAWDAATPEERRERGRLMLVAVYADRTLEEEWWSSGASRHSSLSHLA